MHDTILNMADSSGQTTFFLPQGVICMELEVGKKQIKITPGPHENVVLSEYGSRIIFVISKPVARKNSLG